MKIPPRMRARRGGYGLVVVELVAPTMPHVLLPQDKPAPTFTELFFKEDAIHPARGLQAFMVTIADPPALPPSAPEQLRARKEHEAARSPQPWGWSGTMLEASRVYMSVSGPRWRCCGNAFDEEHSPWCPAPRFNDPLPS